MAYFRDTIPGFMRASFPSSPRALVLTALLLSAAAASPAASAEPGLAIVSFGDYLWLRVDGKAVALEPGSPAYEIPLAARAVVAQGAATLLARDALLRVDAGDDFSVAKVDGHLRLLVNNGAVEVSLPGRTPALIPAGRFAALSGPETGALPGTTARPPAPVAPPPPAVAPPVVYQEPPASLPTAAPGSAPDAPAAELDPIGSLASGFRRLVNISKPDLRLVLELHPFYRFSEVYESNIYLVPREQPGTARIGGGVVSSWITVNELGTGWKLPLSKRHALRGNYSARASHYTTQSRTNNALDQTIVVGWDYSGRKGVTAGVSDSYVNTEDSAFSEQVARQRRMSNEVSGYLDVEHSRRLFTKLTARHVNSKYLDPSLARNLNRYDTSFGVDLGVRVAPKTRTYLAYQREITHYSAGRADHSTGHRGGLGITGILTNRLTGKIQADMHFRRYAGGTANLKHETTNILGSMDLKYQATRRLQARLGAWRSIQESTFGFSRHTVVTGASLGATQALGKWSLGFDGSFETNRYPEATTLRGEYGTRRDDTYTGSLRVDYKVRTWLSTDLSYQRSQRHSRFSNDFNFASDRTTASLRVQF